MPVASALLVERVVLITSLLLLLSVVAGKVSRRLGVPALLLFLLIGMLAGSEGPGGIPYDDPVSAQFLGVIALVFILFAGGLGTDRGSFRQVMWQGLSLATLGVLATAVLTGWFATVVLGFSWLEGLLLGSIVSSTDAAAVFSVLRSQSIGLKGTTQPLLELESGSNDPMAVFLTTAVIGLLAQPGASWHALIPRFALQMALGAALGWAMGKVTVLFLNRIKLETEGLYPVATTAAVLFCFGATSLAGGNGFLAVYLAGIVIGNAEVIHKRSLVRFHDAIAWMMQIAMFLVLGLLVFPSRLVRVAGPSLLIALFLMLVARPVAVYAGLAFSRLGFREKTLIAWVGLRGAVPIVLATFPYLSGLPRSDLYFNVVFFIVLTSVLLQGTTLRVVAQALRLDVPVPPRKQYPLEFVPVSKTRSEMAELRVPERSPAAGRRLLDLHLPESALVVLIGRGDDFIAPRGGAELLPGDTLLVLADKDDLPAVRALIEGPAI